ncbi:MAG: hypothetical protein PHD04_01140 [Candidatus Pacebacteria bacterium]|nr:hypothetical protein [Candidatus Paceibacterota bacterium]
MNLLRDVFKFLSDLLGASSSSEAKAIQTQTVTVNNYTPGVQSQNPMSVQSQSPTRKLTILFIDDDSKFPIVRILRKQEFIREVEILNDISDFSDRKVADADAIFIDIEGVGRILTPKDEGLGLALEIKKRYPTKKLFLYSSNPQRDMTHPAIRAVDGLLQKTAQPAEFIRVLELIKDGA